MTMVRNETPADASDIDQLVAAAFGRRDEGDLVARIRSDGDQVIAQVAVDGGTLVGHILLSRMSAPFRALGLGPVAVLPEWQGRGIGSLLIRIALDQARHMAFQGVFVLGHPDFYRRFGFDALAARVFRSPYAGPHLMVCALNGALPCGDGDIAYARAFAALE